MKNPPDNIEAYFDQFPAAVKKMLNEIRQTIQLVVPDAEECISYGIPTFKLHGNLVHYAAFKNHIGFYPTPSGMEAFPAEIVKYKRGKGSLNFPFNEPLPLDFIREVVKFRVKENLKK
ncbi:iron chaperone [Pararhodonellum marinum]|uniref:iron chaperone n=1 Tax=Pararhodonellum marinum TaxID=2755358 RepID=UPI00189017D1|nr:DUF1801 domain-containing protein [Pararhodonellum marinum]